MLRPPPRSPLFPYTTLFRSARDRRVEVVDATPMDERRAFACDGFEMPVNRLAEGEIAQAQQLEPRSEERRVGKECRSRGEADHEKKKRMKVTRMRRSHKSER